MPARSEDELEALARSLRVYHGNRELALEPAPADPDVAALLSRVAEHEERLRILEARLAAQGRDADEGGG